MNIGDNVAVVMRDYLSGGDTGVNLLAVDDTGYLYDF
jgi:hypothetical protein